MLRLRVAAAVGPSTRRAVLCYCYLLDRGDTNDYRDLLSEFQKEGCWVADGKRNDDLAGISHLTTSAEVGTLSDTARVSGTWPDYLAAQYY